MLAGIIFFTSAIVIIALPKFRKEIKTQTLILFAIVSSIIIFSAVTYYGVDTNRESFFGVDGYAVILICFLLFLLTTPTLFSQVNLSNVFIIFIGLMALVAIYFLASPSGIIVSDDGTKFFEPIITELGIIDTSTMEYQRPVRGTYIPENTSLLKEIALTVFAIFVFQFFTYLTMRGQMSYKKLRPYIPILSIGAITWSALFYGIGFPYWKILFIASIGILTAPLIWQAFNVYRVKLKSEEGLEKWGGLSDDRQN